MRKIKKTIGVTVSDNQVSEMEELGRKFGVMHHKPYSDKQYEESKEINLSKIIQFMLVCGYVRWNINHVEYFEDIIKSKKELCQNLLGNMPLDEEVNRQSVKIPEELYDKLENMRVKLEKPLKETEVFEVPLITMTQLGIRENIKKLSMSEFTNIIISIELKKLKNSLKYLKDNKKKTEMMNVSFALPHYIMLCNYLEECGLKQNTIRYLAVFDLFKTS